MIFGVGYNSKGKYRAYENGKRTKCYDAWHNMMRRCYSPKFHEKQPTYIGCEVVEKWHDYQVFAEWYHNNYYEVGNEVMCLDKDILVKGNKIYSPDDCVFAPNNINMLFVKRQRQRGDLPIGVHECKNGYIAQCADGSGKQIPLGTFDTPHEAFLMYKLNKELLIQGVANEYKNRIPTKLYNALMEYEVNEWD